MTNALIKARIELTKKQIDGLFSLTTSELKELVDLSFSGGDCKVSGENREVMLRYLIKERISMNFDPLLYRNKTR